MKSFLILTLLTFPFLSQAQVEPCLRDAKTHGNHTSPVSPSPECYEIIKSQINTIEAKSKDGAYHAFGMDHMIYVDSPKGRKLLAGDQTELKNIIKIEINEKKKRLIVLQTDSISSFNLDFIGNVSPVSHFKSKKLQNVSRVLLLNNEDLLAIISKNKIQLINSDAESRYDVERTKPKLIHHLEGKNSQLINPSDLIYDSKLGKIFVLDSDRVLIFSISDKKNQSPEKVINSSNLSDVHSGYSKN